MKNSTTRNRRRGFGMVEAAISALILCVMLVLTLSMVGRMVDERRATDDRRRAAIEARNLLERVQALPWSDRTTERASALLLGADSPIPARLGRSKASLEIRDEPGPPAGRRVSVVVEVPGIGGRPAAVPVRLTTWTHPIGSERP
ncbi:MAG: hypothetical protein SFX72_04500 [Isosphaeraceae bacterium]|nr:hypothetical protein [Isosphaeraceae bacterium]